MLRPCILAELPASCACAWRSARRITDAHPRLVWTCSEASASFICHLHRDPERRRRGRCGIVMTTGSVDWWPSMTRWRGAASARSVAGEGRVGGAVGRTG